jgi:hypothetical protein
MTNKYKLTVTHNRKVNFAIKKPSHVIDGVVRLSTDKTGNAK